MPSTPLFRAAALRRSEAAAADQPLMQRAGRAAADLASFICPRRDAPILVLAGPGNNGGDAFEMARLLRDRQFETHVVFVGAEDRLPTDAATAYRRFAAAGGTPHPDVPQDIRWSMIVENARSCGTFGCVVPPAATKRR